MKRFLSAKKNLKRIIALCICCALLAAAVFQNVRSNKKDEGAGGGDTLVQSGNQEDANNDGDVSANVDGEDEETVSGVVTPI